MALINCPECGTQISDRASQCPHCGSPVEKKITCTECGQPLTSKMRICPKCGSPVINQSGATAYSAPTANQPLAPEQKKDIISNVLWAVGVAVATLLSYIFFHKGPSTALFILLIIGMIVTIVLYVQSNKRLAVSQSNNCRIWIPTALTAVFLLFTILLLVEVIKNFGQFSDIDNMMATISQYSEYASEYGIDLSDYGGYEEGLNNIKLFKPTVWFGFIYTILLAVFTIISGKKAVDLWIAK